MTLLPSLHLGADTCLWWPSSHISPRSGQETLPGLLFSPTQNILSPFTDLASDWRLVASDNDLQDPSVGYSLFVLLLPQLKTPAVGSKEKEKTSIFNIPRYQKHRRLTAFQLPAWVQGWQLPMCPLQTGCSLRWGIFFSMSPASLHFSLLGSWLWPPGQTVGWWMQMTPWR